MSKFLNRYTHAAPVEGDYGATATQRQYKEECDVDIMMARFKCGQPLPVKSSGSYGDFTSFGDFQDCLNKINKAKEDFAGQPSHIRERFGHDPNAYMRFVLDPVNEAECLRLGLRTKPTASAADRVLQSLETIANAVTRKGEEGAIPASVS